MCRSMFLSPAPAAVANRSRSKTIRRRSVRTAKAGRVRRALYSIVGAHILTSCFQYGCSSEAPLLPSGDDGAPSVHHGSDSSGEEKIREALLEIVQEAERLKNNQNDTDTDSLTEMLKNLKSVVESDKESAQILLSRFKNSEGGRKWFLEQKEEFSGDPHDEFASVPPPDGWEEYTFSDVRWHYDCRTHALDQTKQLPTLDYWRLLRKNYREQVDSSMFDDPVLPTEGYSLELDKLGSPPPYYAHYSDGMGRGLFASRDIKKGELLHDGTHSDVVFPDAMSWRRFIFALPRKMACDVSEWMWTQRLSPDGEMKIMLGPNISSLTNAADPPNALPATPTSQKIYATVDIKKGEEILTDYSVYETNWQEVGLTS